MMIKMITYHGLASYQIDRLAVVQAKNSNSD